MNLNDLILRLNTILEADPMAGDLMVMDTDGNPIINANRSDMPDEPIVYLEASF